MKSFNISHSKPFVRIKDQRAVSEVLETGMIARGSLVECFEEKVGQFDNFPAGVATASGTAALVLAMKT